ncbi:MAG: serine/threonine protein kinase [Victivallales bacterium]|nr:serine/threonine protein kinase [Victivallales bacterium]
MASGHLPYRVIGDFAVGGVANLRKVRMSDGTIALLRELQTSKLFRFAVRRRFTEGTRHRQVLSPHPNIQNSLGSGSRFFRPYEIIEFVDGMTLRSMMTLNDYRIKENTELIIRQIAQGLSWVHEHRLMHLDVKPENFLVQRNHNVIEVKLTDFDLTREASDNGPHRQMGTPAFMAPEQFIDHVSFPSSDVFAFGLIAYQLLSGHIAFSGKTEKKLWRHQASSQVHPRALHEWNSAISPQLEFIVMKCLEKKLADRYRDMTQVLQALNRLEQ